MQGLWSGQGACQIFDLRLRSPASQDPIKLLLHGLFPWPSDLLRHLGSLSFDIIDRGIHVSAISWEAQQWLRSPQEAAEFWIGVLRWSARLRRTILVRRVIGISWGSFFSPWDYWAEELSSFCSRVELLILLRSNGAVWLALPPSYLGIQNEK